MTFDQGCDEAAGLGFLDKLAEELGSFALSFLRSDGLLDGGELTIEDTGVGQFCRFRHEGRTKPRERIEVIVVE